jgi:hypothetical protein
MSILSKHLELVNQQAEFHEKMAAKFPPESYRGRLHRNTSEGFRALAADLQKADTLLDPGSPSTAAKKATIPGQLSLSLEDIEGLPAELIDELSISGGDKVEFAILNAIEEAGGIISLDRLLIALFKKTGEVHKRASVISRLHRMSGKNLIFSVPGKKGLYSTEQLNAAQAAKLFGLVKEAN